MWVITTTDNIWEHRKKNGDSDILLFDVILSPATFLRSSLCMYGLYDSLDNMSVIV